MSRPPLPQAGRGVILYAPLAIAFGVQAPDGRFPSLFLLTSVTGLFLAIHALGLLLRRRGRSGTAFWSGKCIAARSFLCSSTPTCAFSQTLERAKPYGNKPR